MDSKNSHNKPQLLKELADIKNLLGEDDIPIIGLEPPPGKVELEADIPTLPAERPRNSQNPFLQSGPVEAPADVKPLLRSDPPLIATDKHAPDARPNPFLSPVQPSPKPDSAPQLSNAEQRALVDELLAQWLPKIERELRTRLLESLNNKST